MIKVDFVSEPYLGTMTENMQGRFHILLRQSAEKIFFMPHLPKLISRGIVAHNESNEKRWVTFSYECFWAGINLLDIALNQGRFSICSLFQFR